MMFIIISSERKIVLDLVWDRFFVCVMSFKTSYWGENQCP